MLVRIYLAKADVPISTEDGPNPVRLHGGNCAWFNTEDKRFAVTIRNLSAARNAAGRLAYVIFTSRDDPSWDINEVNRGLLGATYPAGFYEF